jgi:hypothetical protein
MSDSNLQPCSGDDSLVRNVLFYEMLLRVIHAFCFCYELLLSLAHVHCSSPMHIFFVLDWFCQWPTRIVLLTMRNAFVSHCSLKSRRFKHELRANQAIKKLFSFLKYFV